MKLKKRLFCWSFGLFLLAGVAVFANKPAKPPARSEVLGAWSGYTDHLDFLRLEFDDDGKGYLCVGWVGDSNSTLYRVQNWKYSDWKIDLTLESIDSGAETVYLTNIVCDYEDLQCDFGGSSWKRKAKLICEHEWSRRLKPLVQRITRFRNETK